MRPHTHDHEHNMTVGRAFRMLVHDLVTEAGQRGQYSDVQGFVDRGVGEHVNAVAQAAYDLAVHEVQHAPPSQN